MKILAGVLLVFAACLAFGGESPMNGYIECQSAPDQNTIYFSAIYEGVVGQDGNAFAQFLNTKYGYKGYANCSVANKASTTIAHLQAGHEATVAQWRSNGKKVVDTGWTYNGATALTANVPASPVTSVTATPKAPVPDADDQPMSHKNVPMSHFYCETQRMGNNPLYFSGAFEVPSTELAAVTSAFQTYVVNKYGYTGPIAASCSNHPSVAAADQNKQAIMSNLKKTPIKIVDTGWVYKTP